MSGLAMSDRRVGLRGSKYQLVLTLITVVTNGLWSPKSSPETLTISHKIRGPNVTFLAGPFSKAGPLNF